MFSIFSEEAKKVLIMAHKEMNLLKHSYVGTEHLILSILSNPRSKIGKIFQKNRITYEIFKKAVISVIGEGKSYNNNFLYTPLLKRIIEEAMIIAKEKNSKYVEVIHLIIALFEEGDGVAIRVLSFINIDIDSLLNELKDGITYKTKKKNNKLLIDEHGYCINDKVLEGQIDPVIGREKELERIMEILCRRIKNNPLLIGEAGVGKTAIIEELANRIVNNMVPNKLKNKRIISVSMSSLVAGTKYRGEFEERIHKMLKEVEDDENTILFIDEIHTLVGAGGADGAIDASNILKPYLARGKIKLIGATTIDEYKKYLEDDRALDRRFQNIIIKEPDNKTLFEIIKKIKPIYEEYHNVYISESVISTIIELSNKYIYDRKQPDKAIDILDEVCSKLSIKKNKKDQETEKLNIKLNEIINSKNTAVVNQNFRKASKLREEEFIISSKINKIKLGQAKKIKRKVTNKMIAEIVRLKTNIPIYEYIPEDLTRLKTIEKQLKGEIIGQENVINEIANDIKITKLGYEKQTKPKSYLFVGPTGVGKTLLAKKLSNIISSGDIIRLDMSEFKEAHSISKIIGAPPGYIGYSSKTTILDEVKIKPNSVLLLDEIEKAHTDVLSLFFQILDEGFIKNSKNEIIKFNNITIIMTSNIGFHSNAIGFSSEERIQIIESLKNILSIEFINRVDKILMFNKLKESDIRKIIKKEYKTIKNNIYKFSLRGALNDQVINDIIKKSEYSVYGARKIKKILNGYINDIIIKENINKNKIITIKTL